MIAIIKNFKEVIEARSIDKMNKELYQFFNLYCGFIAHYDINGFKDTYRNPRDFADTFIRHFDRNHPYFSQIYACHQESYKDTGLTKAQIKSEFEKIVSLHKDQISRWAREEQRNERYVLYLKLKQEFEGGEQDDHRV